MAIEVWVDGRSFGPIRGCGLSVVLRGDYEWRRGFLIPQKLTVNQLDLKGIEYALKSIIDNNGEVVIYTSNRYSVAMLERKEDGSWSKNVEKNIELITEVRAQFNKFKDIKILLYPAHERFADIKKRTDDMVKNKQEYFDKV